MQNKTRQRQKVREKERHFFFPSPNTQNAFRSNQKQPIYCCSPCSTIKESNREKEYKKAKSIFLYPTIPFTRKI